MGVAVVWAWQLAPSLQQMICPYCDPNYGEGQHADKNSVQLLLWAILNPFKTNFSLTFSKKNEYIFLSYVSIEELFRK